MKKGLAFTLVVLGALALIFGVVMMFTGKVMEAYTWITSVLGVVFFTSGIGLLKNTKE